MPVNASALAGADNKVVVVLDAITSFDMTTNGYMSLQILVFSSFAAADDFMAELVMSPPTFLGWSDTSTVFPCGSGQW